MEKYEKEKNEKIFWFENPKILIDEKLLRYYILVQDATFEENLNSLMRLSFYISCILFFIIRDYRIFYIFILTGIITFLLWKHYKIQMDNSMENFTVSNSNFRYPTKENPLMNPLITEINSGESSKIPMYNNHTNEQINSLLNENTYVDAFDTMKSETNNRQFYTIPGKTIPNDQEQFANFVFNTPYSTFSLLNEEERPMTKNDSNENNQEYFMEYLDESDLGSLVI